MPPAAPLDDTLRGIVLTVLGYSLFAVHDAMVKWLVAIYPVAEVLFVRSVVILVLAFALAGRHTLPGLLRSPNKASLFIRAVLILVAWFAYYTASRDLGLAELTTIYFVAPVIGVILAVFLLGETVYAARWVAVVLGFIGVVIAAAPHEMSAKTWPAVLAFFAACCWALSFIMIRMVNATETTSNQMLASNGLFAVVCAALLFWSWRTPDLMDLTLMIGVGLAGGAAQFCVFEGFRYAAASVVAPLEYTALIWAFLFGYLIWSDIPQANVFAGALLIVVGSLGLVYFERRRQRA